MGKASRRKLKNTHNRPYGFFLDKSYIDNKHMVWLGVRTGNHTHEQYPISTHYQIEDALFGLSQCQRALNEFKEFYPLFLSNPAFNLTREYYRWKLIEFINDCFPYNDDGYIRNVNQDVPAVILIDGNITEVKNCYKPRWGVEKRLISDANNVYSDKQFYGDLFDHVVYILSDGMNFFAIDQKRVLFNSYKLPAKIADCLNYSLLPITKDSIKSTIKSLENYCMGIFPDYLRYHCPHPMLHF